MIKTLKDFEKKNGFDIGFCAGIVARSGDKILVIQKQDGSYSLPKGHVDFLFKTIDAKTVHERKIRYFTETVAQAALREGHSETGHEFEIDHYLGTIARLGDTEAGGFEWKEIDMMGGVIKGYNPPLIQDEREAWIGRDLLGQMKNPEDTAFYDTYWDEIMRLPDSAPNLSR